MDEQLPIKTFVRELTKLTKTQLVKSVIDQADAIAEQGNPYLAALLREISDRYEQCRHLTEVQPPWMTK